MELGRHMELGKELVAFVIYKKKFWLLPILLVLLTIGGILAASQGTVIAPFIYTLF